MSSSMRASRQAYSAATALRRVFITNSLPTLTATGRLPAACLAPATALTTTTFKSSFSHTARSLKKDTALPTNKEILAKYPVVHLVSDNGRLSPPTNTSSILHTIDLNTQSLITVALPPPRLRRIWENDQERSVDYEAVTSHSLTKSKFIPAAEKDGYEETDIENAEASGAYDAARELSDSPIKQIPTLPICKIVSNSHFLPSKYQPKRDVSDAAAKKKKNVNPALTLKTIELNWAIDSHDLKHRLETMRGFLRKGYRVDVLLVGKKRKRKAEPEEAQATLRGVKECIESVEGAKEWKTMEGKVGGMVKLYAEGKAVEEEVPEEPEAELKEEKVVMKTSSGKKLSKSRMKQLGLLNDAADVTV